MSPEAGLALLIVALYLLDSLLLLRPDEAVLVRRGLAGGRTGDSDSDAGRWRAAFGAQGFKLAGREPWLANPWLPHQPVFRLRWRMAQAGADPAATAARSDVAAAVATAEALRFDAPLGLRRLHQLAPMVWCAWLLLFLLIPCTLLVPLGMQATLAAVLLLYLNIVLALALIWRWRRDLGLNGRAFALLAFECLVCAPYSANLVRRLAWQARAGETFDAAAARLLPAAAMQQAHRECLSRIDERLEAEPESGAEAALLREARARLAAKVDAAAAVAGDAD